MPTMTNCTINGNYTVYIYNNCHFTACDEEYEDVLEKRRQRLRYKNGQSQQQQQQQQQQDEEPGGRINYVAFDRQQDQTVIG